MNLMLFPQQESKMLLEPKDPRAVHVRQVLKMGVGDVFDVGAVNGPRGKARIDADGVEGMVLAITWGRLPRPPMPVHLIVGLSRPQTMRKILRELPPLGVASLHCFASDKGEPSYASSSLWTSGEWSTQLLQGAEQAFSTWIPDVHHHGDLETLLQTLGGEESRIALDNYEARAAFHSQIPAPIAGGLWIAVGSERGWSARERDVLRGSGFTLAHLGPRVLRTETAVIAALAIAAAQTGQHDTLAE